MRNLTIALTGSGGAGVAALGDMLLRTVARQGYFGMLRKTFGPQIRGGESAAIIRIGTAPVASFCEGIDALFVLDWKNFQRFSDEIQLTTNTIIIEDVNAGKVPVNLPGELAPKSLDFSGTARNLGSAHSNLVLLGYLAGWLKCSASMVEEAIDHRLAKQPAEVIQLARDVARQGAMMYSAMPLNLSLDPPVRTATNPPSTASNIQHNPQSTWLATGNQLAGLGALEAGIKFVAAYPITPASDALEWLASHIGKVGGHLVQAEDELAAINMAIGAGYAGVPALTATSGPGLALMSEAMGLAVASETPLVILDVMRGGPSTGIPTKSEQSDFNLAIYGLHGDAPHIVLSALSITDCYQTTAWAVQLANELQTLVIVLSDQFLGQSSQILPALQETSYHAELLPAELPEGNYYRYLDTASGVSPKAIPGQSASMYTADGLEHNQQAIPSAQAKDHQQQLAKRLRKLTKKDFGDEWAAISGQGELLLICWGALYHAALEAQLLLATRGIHFKLIAVRLLQPFPVEKLQAHCLTADKLLIIEQNQQGQFAAYLQSMILSPVKFRHYSRPGPKLFTADEIISQVETVLANES